MSCSSASVGFWPSERITVPSSFVVTVPTTRPHVSTGVDGPRAEARREAASRLQLHSAQHVTRMLRDSRSSGRPGAADHDAPSPSLSKSAKASLNSAICSSARHLRSESVEGRRPHGARTSQLVSHCSGWTEVAREAQAYDVAAVAGARRVVQQESS